MTNQEFIDQVAVYVKKYAAIFGICVHSPIIAQAILESGWGKSKLATTYHNYFGLKCGTSFWYQLPAMLAAFCAGRIFEKTIKIRV